MEIGMKFLKAQKSVCECANQERCSSSANCPLLNIDLAKMLAIDDENVDAILKSLKWVYMNVLIKKGAFEHGLAFFNTNEMRMPARGLHLESWKWRYHS